MVEHWKMKSEIMLLKKAIVNYIDTFSKHRLCEYVFGEGKGYSTNMGI